MSAVCPSHEVDELTISLLNIFEARGASFELLEALIKQEIEETGGLFSRSTISQWPL
jgi:neurofibromin 1